MTPPRPIGKQPLLILAAALTALLGLYAAQTSLGHWQVDEFRYFTDHRVLGWRAYFERFYTSPRPLSELFIYAYGAAVLAFERDFIPELLLMAWVGSLLVPSVAAWAVLGRSPSRQLAAFALGLAPMLLVMQIGPVTEMFYWPIATVAYLPAAASITALLFLLDAAPGRARQRWCGAALLAAALCHEVGAAFALSFAGAAGGLALLQARAERRVLVVEDVKAALWWLIPAFAGVLVMLGLVLLRSQFVDLGADTKPYTGLLLASAAAAVWQLLADFVTTANWPHDPAGSLAAVVQKSIFAIGFVAIWLRWGRVRPNRWHAAMVVGLVGAAYFSLLAAFYHYGALCCERHSTLRQWLIELVYILAATVALAGRKQIPHWCGPLLVGVSLVPLIMQVPGTRANFELVPMAQNARLRTWQSGLAAGSRMEFYLPPDRADMLLHGTSVPEGTFDLHNGDVGPNGLIYAIGIFFGKAVVTVCEPWKTPQSWLLNGQFIPACPPHDGPPDIVYDTRR